MTSASSVNDIDSQKRRIYLMSSVKTLACDYVNCNCVGDDNLNTADGWIDGIDENYEENVKEAIY